jgi:hypothetical protein
MTKRDEGATTVYLIPSDEAFIGLEQLDATNGKRISTTGEGTTSVVPLGDKMMKRDEGATNSTALTTKLLCKT